MAQVKSMYLCSMYVRKKHNKSGTTSIVVVSKASGKYKEIKSFGASSSEEEISLLYEKAKAWIHSFAGQQELDFDDRCSKELEETTCSGEYGFCPDKRYPVAVKPSL